MSFFGERLSVCARSFDHIPVDSPIPLTRLFGAPRTMPPWGGFDRSANCILLTNRLALRCFPLRAIARGWEVCRTATSRTRSLDFEKVSNLQILNFLEIL